MASDNEHPISSVGEKWKYSLQTGGYSHQCNTYVEFKRIRRLSRTWRIILKKTGLRPPMSCLEIGCGGGIHLVRLALNGFTAHGLDVSPEVVERAHQFINSVEKYDPSVASIRLMEGDFLRIDVMGENMTSLNLQYDLVYNFGVIEHFLDRKERLEFLSREFKLAKPGGFVISVVPSGMHPYRKEQKKHGWGGYDIPEIDYTPQSLAVEIQECGGTIVKVVPHNLMGYLTLKRTSRYDKVLYYVAQLMAPVLSEEFKCRHAYSFICIGKKLG